MVTDDRTISDVMFEQAELHKEDGKWQSVFGLDVLPEHSAKGMPGSSCGRSSNIPAKTGVAAAS